MSESVDFKGDHRWQDLALAFAGKGLRDFPIEYFGSDELEKARFWLGASPRESAD